MIANDDVGDRIACCDVTVEYLFLCNDYLCGSTVVDLSNVDYVIWTKTRRANSSDCVMSRQLIS